MEIKGKVHCFFEQSGTFKNEFIKLGIPAEDYDIQNNFGETDHTDDLFKAIEDAYDGKPSLFDNIRGGQDGDLIMAFFPCIYFCEANARLFRFEDMTHKGHSHRQAVQDMLKRSQNRQQFFELILKMFCICDERGLRLIVENPYSPIHFLQQYFPYRPSIIDKNRSQRGDYFVKPTQYWFINCNPTDGFTYQPRIPVPVNSIDDRCKNKNYKKMREQGICICSEEKSKIHPDYARNFICDFILGKPQPAICPTLFDAM